MSQLLLVIHCMDKRRSFYNENNCYRRWRICRASFNRSAEKRTEKLAWKNDKNYLYR